MTTNCPQQDGIGSLLERWFGYLPFAAGKKCMGCTVLKKKLDKMGARYARKNDLEISKQIALNVFQAHLWHVCYFFPLAFLAVHFLAWLSLRAAIFVHERRP